jgi:CubicO group peptidase (beta-lactamase class C family)
MRIDFEKFILSAALLLIAGSASAQPRRPVLPSCADAVAKPQSIVLDCSTLAELDAAAAELVATGITPGLALGVEHKGRLVLNKGYGRANLETGTPVAPETVFNIISVTKTFTAAAIMQLAESGKLGIDDKLSKFIPSFPRGNEVTLRQLLTHTSGVRDWASPDFHLNKVGTTPEALIDYIAGQKPLYDFEPGTKWRYSNAGYSLLGYVIEKASGQSYADFMAQSIFAKAGMRDTAVDRNVDVVEGRAMPYIPDPNAPSGFINGVYVDWSLPWAGGAIRSTVPDLVKYFSAFYGGRIVSPAGVEQMMAPHRLKNGEIAPVPGAQPGTAWSGLGLEVRDVHGHRTVSQGGSFPGWDPQIRTFIDQDIRIIILTNAPAAADVLEGRILKILLDGKRAAQRKGAINP